MNTKHKVDDSCMARLANAVESLLLTSDLDKGLQSAFISLIPLREQDFPTAELSQLLKKILEKHSVMINQSADTFGGQKLELGPLLSHARYSKLNGRTKHWFKKQIWELFYGSVLYNDSI